MSLPSPVPRGAGWLEKALWTCALLCLGLCAASYLAHGSAQKLAQQPPEPMPLLHTSASATGPQATGITAALRIPSLQLAVPVFSGCTFLNLQRGACHLEGSADFGGLGNAAVAGHRDTDFRPLERLRKGTDIFISEEAKQNQYVVDSFEIVAPEDVRVLDIHDRPELTLITCYPFRYVGPAPKRFIVHAHLVLSS